MMVASAASCGTPSIFSDAASIFGSAASRFGEGAAGGKSVLARGLVWGESGGGGGEEAANAATGAKRASGATGRDAGWAARRGVRWLGAASWASRRGRGTGGGHR